MRKTFLLICAVALATSSCTSSKTSLASLKKVLNAKWALQTLTGQSGLNDLFGSKLPFLQFDTQAKRVSGNNGCNNIAGPLTVEQGNKISFGQLAGTKMACPGQGESVFMEALSKVTNFKIDNGILKLLNEDQQVMSFVKGDR